MIHEGDPRYSLCQDILEGDSRAQDAAFAQLTAIDKLVQRAEDVVAELNESFLPEDLRAAGYRFVFETTPIPIKEKE